jgi:hypothetical protein
MENEILHEIQELRLAITKVVGTSNKQTSEQFSSEALDKAAEEFQQLSIERGEWIEENNIDKIIKGATWRAGKFIREHFKFNNYFQKGRNYYYNKIDLQKLARELKERNVDLGRYIEYLEDEAKFKAFLDKAKENKKGKKFPYEIPEDLHDIVTSPAKPPARDIIRTDIKNLKRKFRQYGLDDYIDVYRDKYAMMKYIYFFDKYMEPTIRSRCKKWVKDFNYANTALETVNQHEKERKGK